VQREKSGNSIFEQKNGEEVFLQYQLVLLIIRGGY
jgi:hypothetical protein